MKYGVDIFALVVVGAAFLIGQIRQIPARIRFFIMATAFGVVAFDKLQTRPQGFNLAMVVVAILFCVYYFVKGLRYRAPPSD